MPKPGEVMYSDDWMHRNGKEIPFHLQSMCRDVCKAYDLGNDKDLLLIYLVLKPHIEFLIKMGSDIGYAQTCEDEGY